VLFRGVHQARLPGPKVPFKTLTLPLRFGDPGYQKQHHITLPRLSVQPVGDNSALSIKADSTVTSLSSKPLGYDIELVQAGKLLARFRLAGRCSAVICKMRPVKVHL
jgi:hypothetical protein